MNKKEMQDYLRQLANNVNSTRATLTDIVDSVSSIGFVNAKQIDFLCRTVSHAARLLVSSAIGASDLIAIAEVNEDGKVLKEWDFTQE